MIDIGSYNELRASRQVEFGYYLTDGETEVLIPNKYVPEGFKVGDIINVFIYKDSEDRIIATTLKPYAQVGEFAYLRVKEVNKTGAFLDWGLEKDLMVPFREQSGSLTNGMKVFVYVFFDHRTERIAASMKISDFVRRREIDLSEGQKVNLLIGRKTELGYNVIIDNLYEGLIYQNEINIVVSPGEKVEGYVKKIRDDKKVDVIIDKPGYDKIEPSADMILDRLKFEGGFLELHDKSESGLIKERLGMSKKTFKKAIGALYKKKLITLHEGGIRLADSPDY